ncbi:MAG: hypothetical protein ACYTEG_11580 [Planctomycetota bacterium]|jgi:hypothetical protein
MRTRMWVGAAGSLLGSGRSTDDQPVDVHLDQVRTAEPADQSRGDPEAPQSRQFGARELALLNREADALDLQCAPPADREAVDGNRHPRLLAEQFLDLAARPAGARDHGREQDQEQKDPGPDEEPAPPAKFHEAG